MRSSTLSNLPPGYDKEQTSSLASLEAQWPAEQASQNAQCFLPFVQECISSSSTSFFSSHSISSLSRVSNVPYLQMLYLNARSILSKIDKFFALVEANNPDLICTTETCMVTLQICFLSTSWLQP